MPLPVPAPSRRDRLWEATCVELFLARRGSPGYWEVNLSPSGDWNVYRFDAYREGMREEKALSALPIRTIRGPAALRLHLDLALDELLRAEDALEAGVSAVLGHRGGGRTYWALAHCGPRPDFHLRESFLAHLPRLDRRRSEEV